MRINIALLCIVLLTTHSVTSAQTLTFRKSMDWCPYECDETGDQRRPGILAEVLKAALPDHYRITFVDYAFNRSLIQAEQNKLDGVLGVYISDAPALLLHKQPIVYSTNSFFVNADDSWRYRTLDSLDELRTKGWMIFSGYSYPIFDEFISNNPHRILRAEGTLRTERALKMLALGRIQTLYEDINVINYVATNHALLNKIVEAGGDEKRNGVFIAFAPTRGDLLEEFEVGLRRIRKNGTLDSILSAYNVLPTEPSSSNPERLNYASH